MRVDIYRSTVDDSYFLTVAAGSDPTLMAIPASLGTPYTKLELFKADENMMPNDHRAGFSVKDMLEQIEAVGFATTSAPVTVGLQTRSA